MKPHSESISYWIYRTGQRSKDDDRLDANLALKHGLIVYRTVQRASQEANHQDERKTDGLTMTPRAQSLTEGPKPLSGGGWKAPQYGYCET
jgi:hypothetical protein